MDWLRDTVEVFGGPGVRVDLLHFLFFSFPQCSRRVRITLGIWLADYVFCMWVRRIDGYEVGRICGFLQGLLHYTMWKSRRSFPRVFADWFTGAYVRGTALV